MATIIKANGTEEEVEPKNGKDFQLEELNKIVGGWIEILHLRGGKMLVLNEEGKLEGLSINNTATKMALKDQAIFDTDYIVGNVLLCNNNQVK